MTAYSAQDIFHNVRFKTDEHFPTYASITNIKGDIVYYCTWGTGEPLKEENANSSDFKKLFKYYLLEEDENDVWRDVNEISLNDYNLSDLGSVKDRSRGKVAEGRKNDQGKTRWSLLIALKSTRMVAEVLTFGARKYAPNNFKYVKGWRWRYVDATFRHINAHLEGDIIDPETGCYHLAQATASLLMLLDNELNNMPNGDDE